MSIQGEIKQQVAGVLELSAEARDSVEEAAELIDSTLGRLSALLETSRDPKAAQAVRSLILARDRLTETSGLFGRVVEDLPVFLDRLGGVPAVDAAGGASVATSHKRTGEKGSPVTRPRKAEDPVTEEKTFRAWWGSKTREIADAGSAESVIGEAADRLFSDGVRGVAVRIGDGAPEGAPLRIYIDRGTDRAAVSWQGAPGIESGVDADQPLIAKDDPEMPPVTIPAERARVTPAAAIRAAREYVETGQRPTCLDWHADTTPPTPESTEERRENLDREKRRKKGERDGR
ncbi:Imm1 family immunity protein [Actinomadura sp. DC4]|uniref:Imm1 family immunity protein n=1 Tax=Actinomadura sp. DC4 TaxID=3055069 RepID=UPI0025B1C651|nr:Imm1 family immunity protein [Actinomadura sp. DC4]MDN3355425.1 Imm1 family immunity protein [Actinomadura sp. DC4]